jgi:hypothetical protein
MRPLIVIAALLAVSAAHAQGRPSSTRMTCAAAAGFVQERGAVVLGTGGDTFERVVTHAGYCFHGQTTRPVFAPTLDNRQCMVGWRCFDESRRSR